MIDTGLEPGCVRAQPNCLKGTYENLSGLGCLPSNCSIFRLRPLLQMNADNKHSTDGARNQEQL